MVQYGCASEIQVKTIVDHCPEEWSARLLEGLNMEASDPDIQTLGPCQ